MKTFITSDHHFGHHKLYQFSDKFGFRMRGWASNAAEGDRRLVEAWNFVVSPEDKVYHLGDVAIARKGLELLEQLNGRKVLIKGNHDIFKLKDYEKHFKDIRATWKLDNFVLSHVPIHPNSFPRWCIANIHGHIHQGHVTKKTWYGRKVQDTRYYNVNVDVQPTILPIDFEEIKKLYKEKIRCQLLK